MTRDDEALKALADAKARGDEAAELELLLRCPYPPPERSFGRLCRLIEAHVPEEARTPVAGTIAEHWPDDLRDLDNEDLRDFMPEPEAPEPVDDRAPDLSSPCFAPLGDARVPPAFHLARTLILELYPGQLPLLGARCESLLEHITGLVLLPQEWILSDQAGHERAHPHSADLLRDDLVAGLRDGIFPRLRRLVLEPGIPLSVTLAAAIGQTSLVELELQAARFSVDAVNALLSGAAATTLETLELRHAFTGRRRPGAPPPSCDGVGEALATGLGRGEIRQLSLGLHLGDTEAAAIVRSTRSSLRTLRLSGGPHVCRALAEGPPSPLESLSLSGRDLHDEHAAQLRCESLPRLRHLGLAGQLTADTLSTLVAKHRSLPDLEILRLECTLIEPADLKQPYAGEIRPLRELWLAGRDPRHAPKPAPPPTPSAPSLAPVVGDTVVHPEHGRGRVAMAGGRRVAVRFESGETKTVEFSSLQRDTPPDEPEAPPAASSPSLLERLLEQETRVSFSGRPGEPPRR